MDITLTKNQLDSYCEKYLLENYNKYLNENKLQHNEENFKDFITIFLTKKS